MNKRFFFLTLSVVFLFSCNSEGDSLPVPKIEIGPGYNYLLTSGEKHMELNKDIVKNYENVINKYLSAQVPLSNYVHHKDYDIYFGLLVGCKIPKYIEELKKDSAVSLLDEKKLNGTADNNKYFFKSGELFNYGHYFEFADLSLKYATTLSSKDSSLVAKLYHENYISNQIQK